MNEEEIHRGEAGLFEGKKIGPIRWWGCPDLASQCCVLCHLQTLPYPAVQTQLLHNRNRAYRSIEKVSVRKLVSCIRLFLNGRGRVGAGDKINCIKLIRAVGYHLV